MNHYFDTGIAEKTGIPGAIIYQNILFWVNHNRRKGKNFWNDSTWVLFKGGAEGMRKAYFPYLTTWQVRQGIKKLKDLGLIKHGYYNRHGHDRTRSWAICDEVNAIKKSKFFQKNGGNPHEQTFVYSANATAAYSNPAATYSNADENTANLILKDNKKDNKKDSVLYSDRVGDNQQLGDILENSIPNDRPIPTSTRQDTQIFVKNQKNKKKAAAATAGLSDLVKVSFEPFKSIFGFYYKYFHDVELWSSFWNGNRERRMIEIIEYLIKLQKGRSDLKSLCSDFCLLLLYIPGEFKTIAKKFTPELIANQIGFIAAHYKRESKGKNQIQITDRKLPPVLLELLQQQNQEEKPES